MLNMLLCSAVLLLWAWSPTAIAIAKFRWEPCERCVCRRSGALFAIRYQASVLSRNNLLVAPTGQSSPSNTQTLGKLWPSFLIPG